MHWLWKVLIVVALVLSVPSAIWVIKEIAARVKAKKDAEKK